MSTTFEDCVLQSGPGEDVGRLLVAIGASLPYKSFPVEFGATVMPASAVADEPVDLPPVEPMPRTAPSVSRDRVFEADEFTTSPEQDGATSHAWPTWRVASAEEAVVTTLDAVPATKAATLPAVPMQLSTVFRVLLNDGSRAALASSDGLRDQLHSL